MRHLPFLLLLALAACKGRQPAVDSEVSATAVNAPDWVRARPVTSAYYIGIGMARKDQPGHMEVAKQNALNDLASEISVTVESNSLLHTLDQGRFFNETFTSAIRTRTSEQIEGFELVDSWEDNTHVHVYYRLSKSEHARLKAQRRQQAMDQALDLYGRAQSSLASGDLRGAMDLDLRALLAMKDHWAEAATVDMDGRTVVLGNEIHDHLKRLTSGTVLGIIPERCVLDHGNGFQREMLIAAEHRQGTAQHRLAQLPLVIEYPGQNGPVTERRSTNNDGHARTVVQQVRPDGRQHELVVRLDMDALASRELEPKLVPALLAGLTVPEKRVVIEMVMPRVLLRANEHNLGAPVGDAGLASTLRQELATRGFRMVEKPAEADLVMELNASTRSGGETAGFHTAYLDMRITVQDRSSGHQVYEGGRQGVKGVQLDLAKAGLDAYKRAAQDLRNEVVPALINAVM